MFSQPPFWAVGRFVCFSARLALHYFTVYSGYFPFTRENRKFQLENQMVRAIRLEVCLSFVICLNISLPFIQLLLFEQDTSVFYLKTP